MKQKAETIVSPVGTAAFSWLTKPDTAFGQNHFKVTLLLDKASNDNKAFVKTINDAHKKAANGHSTPSPVEDGDQSKAEGHAAVSSRRQGRDAGNVQPRWSRSSLGQSTIH